ncbi:MAG: hypothetical protein KGI33_05285 [Thaumarchaeota archaeon]|nr:hypothetical protein [Nitrososphaerota archaeon]
MVFDKEIFRKGCSEYVQELEGEITKMMEMYKNNPTFPYDFYNISLREASTKIQAAKELYRRLTEEDL